MNKYLIDKIISNSSNSIIYLAKNIEKGETVIIKKFKKKFNNWDDGMNINEISILCKFNNKHIIKIIEVIKKNLELNIIYEYGGINLNNYLLDIKNNIKEIDEWDIRNIFYQIVIALNYIHKMGFIHQNFVPENILILNKKVKIIGFANCLKLSSKKQNFMCNIWYRSPEMLLGMSVPDQKNDIFALGILLLMFYKLKVPFQGCDIKSQLNSYSQVLGIDKLLNWKEGYSLLNTKGIHLNGAKNFDPSSILPNLNHNATILASQILNMNRNERPLTGVILNYPFFIEIHEIKKVKDEKKIKNDYYKLVSTYGQNGMGYFKFEFDNNIVNDNSEKNNLKYLSRTSKHIIQKNNKNKSKIFQSNIINNYLNK